MTIEIHVPGRAFSRAFFAPARFEGQIIGDVWGLLYRDGKLPWTFHFRIRTYATSDPHDGQDQKTWMRAELYEDEGASAKAVVGMLRDGFKTVALDRLQETVLSGLSQAEVQDKLMAEKWSHPVPNSKGGSA